MRIKSYYANTVHAAFRQALEELGSDAVLIESHPAPAETRSMGEFEVVCGIVDNPAAKANNPKRPSSAARQDDLAAELKMLRSQMDELRNMLQPPGSDTPATDLDEIRSELIAADIGPDLAAVLVDMANAVRRGSGSRQGPAKDALRRIVETTIHGRLQISPDIDWTGHGNVIVFVGPPGAGKTTSLAKIAVKHCLAARRSLRIISVDTERVGVHERLRALAGVMGVACTAASSIGEFQDALRDGRGKDYILVDTPGFSAADMDAARELAAALKRVESREVYLVQSACAKRQDLAAFSERFSIFKPTKLLFTKMDETTSTGSVISETLRLEKPLSFFGTGQGIPEDLEEASAEALIRNLFPTDRAAAASAA